MELTRICFRYGDKRIFSRLVALLRGGDSAHCEAAWAWDGEQHHCVSASWLDGGVRTKDIGMPADRWRIYEVPVSVLPLDWVAQHAGARYDVLGLLGILWPWLGHRRHRWFCSEACADMLGLPEPQLFDLRTLESVCQLIGRRVQ